MKQILLFLFIIPCTAFTQGRWSDDIYRTYRASYNRINNNGSTVDENQTPLITGTRASDIKISMRREAFEFPRTQALNVYPNPAMSDSRAVFTSRERGIPYHLQMISVDGKPLLQQKGITVEGTNTINLDMSSYPIGTYLLQLFVGESKQTVRFIKAVK